jgi:hypothetical protein
MNDPEAPPETSVVRDTGVTIMIHAIIWCALSLELMVIFPPIAARYKELNLRFPAASEAAFALSGRIVGHWYVLPLVLTPLLLADGAVYFMLRQAKEGRLLGRLWAGMMVLLPLLIMAWFAFSLLLSWLKIQEALAR